MLTYSANDPHGKRSIPGSDTLINAASAKRIHSVKNRFPKPKNGITDPFTYLHVVDVISNAVVGVEFRTKDILDVLRDRPMEFDSITVGRVVNDIAESLEVAYGRVIIRRVRYWDGIRYEIAGHAQDRAALHRLFEDLWALCEDGIRVKNESPLFRCPSIV